MATRIDWIWRAERPGGMFGKFADREAARRAEESWWASPLNVTYEQWIERHVSEREEYPRWNVKAIRWGKIIEWTAEIRKAGGRDGMTDKDQKIWTARFEKEAERCGKLKVEQEGVDLAEHNKGLVEKQRERSRRYQNLRRQGLRKPRPDRNGGRGTTVDQVT